MNCHYYLQLFIVTYKMCDRKYRFVSNYYYAPLSLYYLGNSTYPIKYNVNTINIFFSQDISQ